MSNQFDTCAFEELYKDANAAAEGQLVTDAIIEEVQEIKGQLDLIEQTQHTSVAKAVEIGKLLHDLKADKSLKHGAWMPYLNRFIVEPTGIEYKTLSTWMKFAKHEALVTECRTFADANKAITAATKSTRKPRKVNHDAKVQRAAAVLLDAIDEAGDYSFASDTLRQLEELRANIDNLF